MDRQHQPSSNARRRQPLSSTSSVGSTGSGQPSFVTCMAICLVSACCQLASRAFWIELPVVLPVIPPALPAPTPSTRSSFAAVIQEGGDASLALAESYGTHGAGGSGDSGTRWSLPVENQGRLFAAVVVGSNAAACFFYLAARRVCSRHRRPVESRAVWASLAIGVASLAIAACGFELGSRLDDEEDGAIFLAGEIPMVTVLIGAALSSVGATTGALALMSVIGQFGTVTSVGGVGAAHYVCAAMFGDALASAVPRGLSVAQGVGRPPDNSSLSTVDTNDTTSSEDKVLQPQPPGIGGGGAIDDGTSPSYRSEAIVGARLAHRFYGAASSSSSRGSDNGNWDSYGNSAGIDAIYGVGEPLFAESIYFASCAAFVLIGAVCFAAIRCCPRCCPGIVSGADSMSSSRRRNNGTGQSSRNGNDDRRPNVTFVPLVTSSPARRIDDATPPTTHDSNNADANAKSDVASDPLKNRNATVAVLDDGTERQGTGCASVTPSGGGAVVTNRASTNAGTTNESSPASGSLLPQSSSTSRQQLRPQVLRAGDRTTTGSRNASYAMATAGNGRPKLFQLLMAIVLLTTVVLSGLLSDVLAHANYPTGSWTFAVGAAGCDIASAAACIVAARANARSEMATVIAMTCLGTIVLTYFGALVAFGQHVGVARGGVGFGRSAGLPGGTVDTALLMGSTGEYLAVAAWITVVAVFSFARVRIGVECRLAGPEALFWYACALRIGDVIGSTSAIGHISVGRFFRHHLRGNI